MPQDLQSIVQRMVEAGESEADIASVIQHYKAPSAEPSQPGMVDRVLADNPALPAGVRAVQGLGRLIKAKPVESAATAGAMLAVPATGGASLGAVPAMIAAGLGGAGGAGLAIAGRQLATGRPEPGGQTAATMAEQGVVNAAGEGISRGIAAGADYLVPKVLKGILRPGKNVQQEFGDVVDVMRKERIPIGGSETAGARMKDSAKAAKQLVADAEAAGAAPIRPREVTSGLKDVTAVTKKRARLGKLDETGDVADRARNFYRQNREGISLTDAQALKQQAQQDASAVFRAMDRGNVVNDVGGLTDKAMATGLRRAVESRVPEVGPVNARTQDLMGLQGALEDAEMRSGAGIMNLNPLSWLGNAVPSGASRLAFGADAAARASGNPMAKLIQQALLSLLAGESKE